MFKKIIILCLPLFLLLQPQLPTTFAAPSDHFVTTWDTTNPGTSSNTEITIPTTGAGYLYDVDWDNDGTFDEIGLTGDVTHDFGAPGIYTIRIQGNFPRIFFNNSGDREKITSIDQWGTIAWSSMDSAFWGCSNLEMNALDTPDLTLVSTLRRMFAGATSVNQPASNWAWNTTSITDLTFTFLSATSFNADISSWDVSNVTSFVETFHSATNFNQDIGGWITSEAIGMSYMFLNAANFNQDIGGWDVSKVRFMTHMFRGATDFNQDLSSWVTGAVEDMSYMFLQAVNFNGDISSWDTSSLTNTNRMFEGATSFNQDLSGWTMSGVTNMGQMFKDATSFNGDISNWDTPALSDMTFMFEGASSFNQDLSGWTTDGVSDMTGVFRNATNFDQDVSNWNVSGVTNMQSMFEGATNFNQDLSSWITDSVQNMSGMFLNASSFDGDIDGWNTGEVLNMAFMFNNASAFNQDLNNWDVSKVTTTRGMFLNATNFNGNITGWVTTALNDMFIMFQGASSFNQDISSWNTAGVTDMTGLFLGAEQFNQDIGGWVTSLVTQMPFMFSGATNFNQDISGWDVSNVQDMSGMFQNAVNFNQPIGIWTTSDLTNTFVMFQRALSFDQNLGAWDVEDVTNMDQMFSDMALSINNYDNTLIGWDAQNLQNGVTFSGGNSTYCNSVAERTNMETSDNWIITDGGLNCNSVPSDIFIDGNDNDSIREDLPLATNIGTLTTVDIDVLDTHTYSLACTTPGPDDTLFQINGDQLQSNAVFDFSNPIDSDTDGIYEVCVRTTDSGTGNLTFDKILQITVTQTPSSNGGGGGGGSNGSGIVVEEDPTFVDSESSQDIVETASEPHYFKPTCLDPFIDTNGHFSMLDICKLYNISIINVEDKDYPVDPINFSPEFLEPPQEKFFPNTEITRGEFLKYVIEAKLYLENTELPTSTTNPYPDVLPEDKYYKYSTYGTDIEILKGYGDGFARLDQAISRAEALAMLTRALGVNTKDYNFATNPFQDINQNDWYAGVVTNGHNLDLISGYSDGTFSPNRMITKGESSAIVRRYLEHKGVTLVSM